MKESKFEEAIAKEAIEKGWAEDKVKFCARLLRILVTEVKDPVVRVSMRNVIRYLEAYEFDVEGKF